MRRYTLPLVLALSIPALAGCPSTPLTMSTPKPFPGDPLTYTPARPMPNPMMTSAPAYPGMGYPVPTLTADGSSMDDAYHYVQGYVSAHYPGAEIVAIRSAQIGLPGRIAKTGSWSFTYRMQAAQQASSSLTAQAITLPSQFESQQLTFKLNGNNEIFAPEVKEKVALQALDYGRVIPLGKALEVCQEFGMTMGPGGVSVALVSDAVDGTYYEIDNHVGYQWASTTPGPYGSGPVAGSFAPGAVLGKYQIDALTGTLIERQTTP